MASPVNVNAAISNLVQMERHQTDTHKTPVVQQDHNATVARQEMEQRLLMPVEPDLVDGKNVDPQGRRDEERRRKRKERAKKKAENRRKADGGDGRNVDLTA